MEYYKQKKYSHINKYIKNSKAKYKLKIGSRITN